MHEDEEGDLFGHGTACAGIIRSLAPECEIHSVRTLGRRLTGRGAVLLAGLRWAIDEGYDVINLSLSMSQGELRRASCASSPTPRTSRTR